MSRKQKLVEKILKRPTEMDFADVERLVTYFGFALRKGTGGHRVFVNTETGQEIAVPTVQGRRVKRFYLQELIKLLDLEVENES